MASKDDPFLRAIENRNRWLAKRMREPATDDSPMDDSPPGCTLADFKRPKLRRCPYDISSVIFRGRLNKIDSDPSRFDGGLDGYNYKISFKRGGPAYVMKVLWDTEPKPPHYFAPRRECQNAALFQMMQAAVSAANAPAHADTPELGPILVNPDPKTYSDAANNYFAFCDEKRANRAKHLAAGDTFPGKVPITEMPRMRRCYGWMRFRGEELRNRLPGRMGLPMTYVDWLRRSIEREPEYTAIIYEYVEQGANDPDVCQPVLDFLRCAGFQFVPISLEKNWQSSILLDHSEVVHCFGYGWKESRNEPRGWEEIVAACGPTHGTTIMHNKAQEQDTTARHNDKAQEQDSTAKHNDKAQEQDATARHNDKAQEQDTITRHNYNAQEQGIATRLRSKTQRQGIATRLRSKAQRQGTTT